MPTKKLFIVVPAPTPDGPIKGAYALANALAPFRDVTLVTLKAGSGAAAPLDPRVHQVSLASCGSTLQRLRSYRALLRSHGGRRACASLSMCFSADLVNVLCRGEAVTLASIRGNLIQNYGLDYGRAGLVLAALHLLITRWFDRTVAMSEAMARQIRRFGGSAHHIIGNFVDEAHLDQFRIQQSNATGPLRLVFLGSMTVRKQPLLLIRALSRLRRDGVDVQLDMLGGGPLLEDVKAEAIRLGIADSVHCHGNVAEPYSVLARADAMVLPSLSEGMSRAVLEALYLGVPCVLRKVDGNSDLIIHGVNGMLIDNDADLPNAMLAAALQHRRQGSAPAVNLLPDAYRQHTCATAYLDVMEKVLD